MTLRLIKTAARIEASDEFHEARLLLLLSAAGGRADQPRPVDGIMKVAKMDFLLRYPNCLQRAIAAIKDTDVPRFVKAAQIPEEQMNTIEGQMIRYRFGPWDKRYRRWLSILTAKQLATVHKEGRTIKVQLTVRGREVAKNLADLPEFIPLVERARLVVGAVGHMPATRLKDFIYQTFPEIVGMSLGETINL